MRLDLISIALRQRNPWESMDLGIALVRRHAGAIWRPWLLLTLPFFVAFNLVGWWFEMLWLAPLFLWWLKPLFDRVPLFVLSRAVFGTVPGTRQTLRSRELWSLKPLLGWLTWRRLHPARSLLLPVDMLEGLTGSRRRTRNGVLQRAVNSQAFGLTFACLGFELALVLSAWTLCLLFVPTEFLSASARELWQVFVEDPPAWARICVNGVLWLAMGAVEPFYVGAGFGLYLNRRTQLEAWDVELSFRRLADRARQAAASSAGLVLVVLCLAGGLAPAPAMASVATEKESKAQPITPQQYVGDAAWQTPDPRFGRSIDKAMRDPLLSPKQEVTRWQLKNKPKPDKKKPAPKPGWLGFLAMVVGAIWEYGLWILAALLLAFVLWRLPRWLPWVQERVRPEAPPSEIIEHAIEAPSTLPDDVPAAARALWEAEHRREALALLYRASVERVAERLGAPFPPGATEAECLRRARRLPSAELQQQFSRVVRTWQAAAYAWRFPDSAQFDALLESWQRDFGART